MKFCGVFALFIIFIAFQVLETNSLDITEAKKKIGKYVDAVDHVDGLKIFQDFLRNAKSDAEIINFAKSLDELESQRHLVEEAETSLHSDALIDAPHLEPSPSGKVLDAADTIEIPEEHVSLEAPGEHESLDIPPISLDHQSSNVLDEVNLEDHDSGLEIPSPHADGTPVNKAEHALTDEPVDLTTHDGIDVADHPDEHEHIDLAEPASADVNHSPNEMFHDGIDLADQPDEHDHIDLAEPTSADVNHSPNEMLHDGIDVPDHGDVHEHIDLAEPTSADVNSLPNEVTLAPGGATDLPKISPDIGLSDSPDSDSDSDSDSDLDSDDDSESDDDLDEEEGKSDTEEGNKDSVDLEDKSEAKENKVVAVKRDLPPEVVQFLETRHIKCFRGCMHKFQEGLIDLLHTRHPKNAIARATMKHLWIEFKNIVTDDIGSRTVEYMATHIRVNLENPLVQNTILKITHTMHEIFLRGNGWEAVHLVANYMQTIVNMEKRMMEVGTMFLNGFNEIKATKTYNDVAKWIQKEAKIMLQEKKEKELRKQEMVRMKHDAEMKMKAENKKSNSRNSRARH